MPPGCFCPGQANRDDDAEASRSKRASNYASQRHVVYGMQEVSSRLCFQQLMCEQVG
jgi:hypothetical protein